MISHYCPFKFFKHLEQHGASSPQSESFLQLFWPHVLTTTTSSRQTAVPAFLNMAVLFFLVPFAGNRWCCCHHILYSKQRIWARAPCENFWKQLKGRGGGGLLHIRHCHCLVAPSAALLPPPLFTPLVALEKTTRPSNQRRTLGNYKKETETKVVLTFIDGMASCEGSMWQPFLRNQPFFHLFNERNFTTTFALGSSWEWTTRGVRGFLVGHPSSLMPSILLQHG